MTDAPSRAEANRRTYDDARLAAIYDLSLIHISEPTRPY